MTHSRRATRTLVAGIRDRSRIEKVLGRVERLTDACARCFYGASVCTRSEYRFGMHRVRNAQVARAKSSNLTNLNLNLRPKHFPLQLIENFIACTRYLSNIRFQKILTNFSPFWWKFYVFFFVHVTILLQSEVSLYLCRALFLAKCLPVFNVRSSFVLDPAFHMCIHYTCISFLRPRDTMLGRLYISIVTFDKMT